MTHAVHREDPTTIPQQLVRVLVAEDVADHGEERCEKLGLQFAPCLAERGCGHWFLARQIDPRAARFLPERIEHQAVAATSGIGSHEQEQGHQQLGRQRPRASEVRRLAATVFSPCRLEQLSDKNHQRLVERRKYGGAGFCQPLACQLADFSSHSRRNSYRRLSGAHSTTLSKLLHAPAHTTFRSKCPATSRSPTNNKVNGIGPYWGRSLVRPLSTRQRLLLQWQLAGATSSSARTPCQ